tara:strand:- start:849 stop:1121 length:273 start_codon:yes stop_codon:yes gene_type:complete
MKKLLISILAFGLLSCGNNLHHKDCGSYSTNRQFYYTITDINSFSKRNSEYIVESNTPNHYYFLDDIQFIDVHGKYAIGDTIYIKINKTK